MKVEILTLLMSLILSHSDGEWSNPLTSEARGVTKTEAIPEKDFFEISASRRDAAESMLESQEFVQKWQDDIKYFGQKNFQCESPKQPYLIRALYSNGTGGKFLLKKIGDSVLVSHVSLGRSSSTQKTALIVCLDFQPKEIFNQISGAM